MKFYVGDETYSIIQIFYSIFSQTVKFYNAINFLEFIIGIARKN